MPTDFCHLHVHTDLSVLDGLDKPVRYVERAKELGQPAIAITDHGNLCGAPEFYFEARKLEVEPVIGSEFYFVPDFDVHKEAKGKKTEDDEGRYHLTVLAKGAKGYRALSELSTESFRHFYYKPIIDRRVLADADLGNLVILSGCASSVLSRLAAKDQEAADEEMLWWVKTCPNFYIEVMHHGTEFDWKLNTGLAKLARKHEVPHVITNDPHYVDAGDCVNHDVLLAIGTGKQVDDPDRMRFDGEGYWLKSEKEMLKTWSDYKPRWVREGLDTAGEIAWSCRTRIKDWEKRTWHIPTVPGVEDGYAKLERLTTRALKKRKLGPEYVERLEHELGVIKEAGIADCLLITRDIIRYAHKQGIHVGPGRGSVCGSLVAYLAGLHRVDPIRYNLLFERFLNPARPSMPDIDTDFSQERREELFAYVERKYGIDNVLPVGVYQRKHVRGIFNALAKSNGIPTDVARKINGLITKYITGEDRTVEETNESLLEELRAALEKSGVDESEEFIEQVERLMGVRSGFSQHPAGVLIAPPEHSIRHTLPQMMIGSSKKWVAQYDLEGIERMGYLKQDFLGLRTLDTIFSAAVDLIEERTGERLDPYSWVPDEEEDDAGVYRMLSDGDTAGVFQLEGGANTRGVQQIGCRSFEDIVSCTALYRSGPIAAGFPEQFVENRERGRADYLHPDLEPILGATEGVILYQEQVMEIGRVLGGFDMAMVDEIKDMVKKKDERKLEKLRPAFFKGCAAHGVKKSAVKLLWEQLEGYVGYSFNRSHAVAYSMLSYQTARLKYLYPLEFYTALVRTVGEKDKRQRYLREIVKRGYKVLRPDINTSEAHAIPVYDPEGIQFGLQDIAGIGAKRLKRLLGNRPFRHAGQVAELIDKGTYNALRLAGALRSLGVPGNSAMSAELLGWQFKDRMAKHREDWAELMVEPSEDGERAQFIGEVIEIHHGRTKKSSPYCRFVVRWDPATEWTVFVWNAPPVLKMIPVGWFVRVQGRWREKSGPHAECLHTNRTDPIWFWQRNRWVTAAKIADEIGVSHGRKNKEAS